jgi:hypothetical protein
MMKQPTQVSHSSMPNISASMWKCTRVQLDAAHSCLGHLSSARYYQHLPAFGILLYLQISSFYKEQKNIPAQYHAHPFSRCGDPRNRLF